MFRLRRAGHHRDHRYCRRLRFHHRHCAGRVPLLRFRGRAFDPSGLLRGTLGFLNRVFSASGFMFRFRRAGHHRDHRYCRRLRFHHRHCAGRVALRRFRRGAFDPSGLLRGTLGLLNRLFNASGFMFRFRRAGHHRDHRYCRVLRLHHRHCAGRVALRGFRRGAFDSSGLLRGAFGFGRGLFKASGRVFGTGFRGTRLHNGQHAGALVFTALRLRLRLRRRGGRKSFSAHAFAQAAFICFAARLRLLLGQLAVIAELDRRGIAEAFGRRIGEELLFRAALGRPHGAFEVLLEFSGQLFADLRLHGVQHDADDRAYRRDDQTDDQNGAQYAAVLRVEILHIRIGGLHIDVIGLSVRDLAKPGNVDDDRFGRACLPRRVDRVDAETQLLDAVKLIGLRKVAIAVAKLVILHDLAEQRQLGQHGVADLHAAAIADMELDRGTQLFVFVVERRLHRCRQREMHVVVLDKRQDLIEFRILYCKLYAEAIDRLYMELHGANAVRRDRRLDGTADRLDLIRRKIERLVDRRVDLIEELNVCQRLVARVFDRHDKVRALRRCGIGLYGDLQIDGDGFDRQRIFRFRGHFAAAGNVFDARLKTHILRSHLVLDGNGDGLARHQRVRFQRDRLHALFGIAELQPGHVEIGVVFDRIVDGKGLVRANALVLAQRKDGQLRHNEPLDQQGRDRLAVVRDKRCVAGLLVDDRLRFLPRKRIEDLGVELIGSDRNVGQLEFLFVPRGHGDALVQDHLAVFKPAGELCVFEQIIVFRFVADRKEQTRDRTVALDLRHRIAGDRHRDRMIAVGNYTCRQKNAGEQECRCADEKQNPLHVSSDLMLRVP